MSTSRVFYPRSTGAPVIVGRVIAAFDSAHDQIDSTKHDLNSNAVLQHVASGLRDAGFKVEAGKRADQKVQVPVLFGRNGKVEKYFDVDAFHDATGFVLEVEAGRAVVNNQFLKDLFEACMMQNVTYLGIAVRKRYMERDDFEQVTKFFETLYSSGRLTLPLQGVLIVGY
jgi:hypothetical protein